MTKALASALDREGVEVVVLTGSEQPFDGRPFDVESSAGLDVRRIKRPPEEVYGLDIRRPRVQSVVDELLRTERVDVLHVQHWATLTSELVRGAARLNVPSIVTLHDMWTTCPRFFRRLHPAGVTCPTGDGRDECLGCVRPHIEFHDDDWIVEHIALRDRELRAELAAAAVVTAPSAACRDRIGEHLPWSDPIEIVPHGLLEPVGDAAPVPATSSALRVGTFGNLVEEKGVALLIHEARGLDGLEIHLFGPFLEPAFEQLVKQRAEQNGVKLVCHGPYDASDAHPARQLDVAVFPSLCEETYGLVVEEALVRGVPVVVSDRGALKEHIGDGGIVVPVAELGPLRETLRALSSDRRRLDELRAGIPDRFWTIRDAAIRYRELYDGALESVR